MKQKTTNKSLDTIMQMHSGVDEFKKMVERLDKSRQNLSGINLPHQLWIATKHGCGINTSARAFAEYLYESKMLEFTMNTKHVDFKLEYIQPSETFFCEWRRLDNMLLNVAVAGYKPFFRGVVSIDISAWTKHYVDEAHFQLFLEYIASKRGQILAIFYLHTEDKLEVDRVESSISSRLRLAEPVWFRLPDTNTLVDFMQFQLKDLPFAEDAKTLLFDSIEKVRDSRYFNGFETIKQFSDDILLKLSESSGTKKSDKISAKALSSFSKDSPYINRIASVKKIEFGFNTSYNKERVAK